MNLEQLVTSYEMSKRLKGAGFEADALWEWHEYDMPKDTHPEVLSRRSKVKELYRLLPDLPDYHVGHDYSTAQDTIGIIEDVKYYPAYTFQQLYYELPSTIDYNGDSLNLKINEFGIVLYEGLNSLPPYYERKEASMCNAAAEVVLWCIKNDYLDIKKKS